MANANIQWNDLPRFKEEYLAQRNDVLKRLRKLAPELMQILLMDDDFQAGLSALDPEDRRFIGHEGLRKVIAQGLFYKMDVLLSID